MNTSRTKKAFEVNKSFLSLKSSLLWTYKAKKNKKIPDIAFKAAFLTFPSPLKLVAKTSIPLK